MYLKEKIIQKVCSTFMTKSESEFASLLKGKDCKVLLREFIKMYSNDKNSSFIREMVTCYVAGYFHCKDKLGYDGYFKGTFCEVKPQNITLNGKRRLNASGCFTDFTWRKFNKCNKDNVKMLMSGFVDGKLIFILEFPFRNKNFKNFLLNKLYKYLPKGDVKNRYIRTCKWSLMHVDKVIIRYLIDDFRNYKNKMSKRLYTFLESGEKKLYVGPINKRR